MEYRVAYRDIPWPVAIGVLPGKIIGTFIIKPYNHFMRNWKSILLRWGKLLLFLIVISIVLCFIGALTNYLTDGMLVRWLIHFWYGVQDLFNPTNPYDVITKEL